MATIQRRGSRWRAIVRKAGHPAQSKTFSTKARAVAWARALEQQIESGAVVGTQALEAVTIGQLCDTHLAYLESISSRGRRVLSDDRQIRHGLGEDTPVAALDYTVLKVFCQTRIEVDGVTPSTTKTNIMYLSGALSTGVLELGLPPSIKESMATWREGLTRARLIGSAKRRDRRPTGEELELILTHVHHNRALRQIDYGSLIRFAIASAMRLSEICRLRWEDFDPATGTVVIRDRKHPTGKAGNHTRVPLLGEAQAIIEAQPRVTERIFPFSEESASNGFRRICRSLGISDLKFHDLRHEAISRLFEAGYGIEEVAMVSGHKDWGNLKRYTNLQPERLAAKDRSRRNRPTLSATLPAPPEFS